MRDDDCNLTLDIRCSPDPSVAGVGEQAAQLLALQAAAARLDLEVTDFVLQDAARLDADLARFALIYRATANGLGLQVQRSLMVQADEVIG